MKVMPVNVMLSKVYIHLLEKTDLQLPLKIGAFVRVSDIRRQTVPQSRHCDNSLFLSVVCVPISRLGNQRDDIKLTLTYVDSF